jgi:hypothetical protein
MKSTYTYQTVIENNSQKTYFANVFKTSGGMTVLVSTLFDTEFDAKNAARRTVEYNEGQGIDIKFIRTISFEA